MKKGFTLLELLIVISILAILSTVVVLVLNPAEYLAQARDAQRISDLTTLNSAITFYLANVSNPTWTGCGTIVCTFSGNIPGTSTACGSTSSSTVVTGSGWVPIQFSAITPSSPIGREPVDPTNDTTYKYAYNCSSTASSWELVGRMQSTKYTTGSNNVQSNDGGNNTSNYEIGTDLSLIP